MSKKVKCPECGANAVPIVYGLPGGSLFKQAEKGKVKLGGCIISPSNPAFHCPDCEEDFGSLKYEMGYWFD